MKVGGLLVACIFAGLGTIASARCTATETGKFSIAGGTPYPAGATEEMCKTACGDDVNCIAWHYGAGSCVRYMGPEITEVDLVEETSAGYVRGKCFKATVDADVSGCFSNDDCDDDEFCDVDSNMQGLPAGECSGAGLNADVNCFTADISSNKDATPIETIWLTTAASGPSKTIRDSTTQCAQMCSRRKKCAVAKTFRDVVSFGLLNGCLTSEKENGVSRTWAVIEPLISNPSDPLYYTSECFNEKFDYKCELYDTPEGDLTPVTTPGDEAYYCMDHQVWEQNDTAYAAGWASAVIAALFTVAVFTGCCFGKGWDFTNKSNFFDD